MTMNKKKKKKKKKSRTRRRRKEGRDGKNERTRQTGKRHGKQERKRRTEKRALSEGVSAAGCSRRRPGQLAYIREQSPPIRWVRLHCDTHTHRKPYSWTAREHPGAVAAYTVGAGIGRDNRRPETPNNLILRTPGVRAAGCLCRFMFAFEPIGRRAARTPGGRHRLYGWHGCTTTHKKP